MKRLNVSDLIIVTEKKKGRKSVCACVCVCWSIWLYRVEVFHLTLSALSDRWPDYKNNDSSGCALQDCCIGGAGKAPAGCCCLEERVWFNEVSHKITAHPHGLFHL